MHVGVHTCSCTTCVWVTTVARRAPEARVMGSCELPNMRAGSWPLSRPPTLDFETEFLIKSEVASVG